MSLLQRRYRRIIMFFASAILSLAVWELVYPRIGLGRRVRRTRSERFRSIAARFRRLAVEMGGVLIKVGQFLSTRLDVLPEEMTSELAGLQDEVPPETFADIRAVAEAEFGGPLSDHFTHFEERPLAAASLGQVHRATLRAPVTVDGPGQGVTTELSEVVVKVQRPNIEQIIGTDLDALRVVGRWLMRYPPISRRVNILALLSEFRRVIHDEIDYLAEGRNAETFAANFKNRPEVRVPHVVWAHTTRRVLTLEDVGGIKITDYDAITAAGIDRKEVARRLFRTYLQQIFEDSFYHADPHPGNLFVSKTAEGWVLTFVDFGMAGRITPRVRLGLRETAIGIGTRDAGRLTKASQMLGMLLPGADLTLIQRAEAEFFDRFWGMTVAQFREMDMDDFRELTKDFGSLVYSLPLQIPQELIVLGRMIGILGGMCTGIDPDFNLWDNVTPYTQRLLTEESGSRLQVMVDELGRVGRALAEVPDELLVVLRKLEAGEIKVQMPEMIRQMCRLELTLRRAVGGVIFTALLVGGVQLYLAGDSPYASAVLIAGAMLTMLWIMVQRCPD